MAEIYKKEYLSELRLIFAGFEYDHPSLYTWNGVKFTGGTAPAQDPPSLIPQVPLWLATWWSPVQSRGAMGAAELFKPWPAGRCGR